MCLTGIYHTGDVEQCEDDIKENSKGRVDDDAPEDARAPSMGAKSLCIPFEQPTGEHALKKGVTKCVHCGENAKVSFFKTISPKYRALIVG